MIKKISAITVIGLAMLSAACDEDKPAVDEKAAVEKPAAPAEKTAEEKAAEEKAAEEAAEAAKKAEAQAKAAEEMAKDPLIACCSALGQKAFTLRSPEYQSASKVCGGAMKDKKPLSSVLAEIKKELKAEPLPDKCAAN